MHVHRLFFANPSHKAKYVEFNFCVFNFCQLLSALIAQKSLKYQLLYILTYTMRMFGYINAASRNNLIRKSNWSLGMIDGRIFKPTSLTKVWYLLLTINWRPFWDGGNNLPYTFDLYFLKKMSIILKWQLKLTIYTSNFL